MSFVAPWQDEGKILEEWESFTSTQCVHAVTIFKNFFQGQQDERWDQRSDRKAEHAFPFFNSDRSDPQSMPNAVMNTQNIVSLRV